MNGLSMSVCWVIVAGAFGSPAAAQGFAAVEGYTQIKTVHVGG